MATLDEVISQMSEEDYFSDPIQFIIDSDLRMISVPDRGVVAGVVGDKNVNRINFQMPRYYNGFDMSKFKTRINYVDAKGNPNYYTVTDSIIKDDLLIFSWLVDADVVAYVGTVAFSVNMVFTDGNGVTKQAFNTSDAGRLKVLEGIQVEKYTTPEEQADILSRLEADVTKHTQVCIENAKTEVMRYAKNEAVESMKTSAKTISDNMKTDITEHTRTAIDTAETEVMRYAKNEAVESMTASAQMITNTNMEKVKSQGKSECIKLEQKGNEMLSELKRKLCFSDETSGKTYIGELKIINGKPALEYEESTI